MPWWLWFQIAVFAAFLVATGWAAWRGRNDLGH